MGNRDGDEGDRDNKDGEADKVASVDEGRCSDTEGARAPADENKGDRAELKRSYVGTRKKASTLGVLGGGRGRKTRYAT
jgi:hypothetical protein